MAGAGRCLNPPVGASKVGRTQAPIRANNAVGAFNNAFACTAVQGAHPQIERLLEALHLQQNMKCVATKTVSAQRPISDRELSEIDGGLRKNIEKRQKDRNAMFSAIAVRFADNGDIARLMRGISHNYMCAKFKTM